MATFPYRCDPPTRRDALTLLALLLWARPAACLEAQGRAAGKPPLPTPLWVYDNWSAYDELSDNVKLTEALAMRELDEMLRLRRAGVRLDYYLMDAFWFAPDGGYRKWREEGWPDGPERWLAACRENGILPGLWFGSNTLTGMSAAPQWRSSLAEEGGAMSFYSGGFLADFMDVLQHWYDRGVRLFKFDFADFTAAARGDERSQTPEEIRRRNRRAFRDALRAFRHRNPDAVLLAYNGFGGEMQSTAAPFPFADPVSPRWLDVFDALYSGDPRPADVPEMDFWRSMDIYSDHMVRRFEQSGIPLERIDSAGFMIGTTATNYARRTNAWQGMLLLSVARGGRITTLHGNLEFLDEEKARWLAKVQAIYAPLRKAGTTRSFGGIPGEARPYGFVSEDDDGALYTVVNPAQRVETIRLPRPASGGEDGARRVLFRDAGFVPVLAEDEIRLGPGQMALVGFKRYAGPDHDLGTQADIRIPRRIEPLAARFTISHGSTAIETVVTPPASGDLRIVMQQHYIDGSIIRSTSETGMGQFFVIRATQDGRDLPVRIEYDKIIWSGLSWAAGEIRRADIAPGSPIRIHLSSTEPDFPVRLEGHIYRVAY